MSPTCPTTARRQPGIVVVSTTDDDRKSIEMLLWDWAVDSASSLGEAMALIAANQVGVVVCREDFAGGAWSDLLRELERLDAPPPLIVLSHRADEHLWARVLRAGAYDLLAMPLEPADAMRAISHAVSHFWQRTAQPRVSRMAAVVA